MKVEGSLDEVGERERRNAKATMIDLVLAKLRRRGSNGEMEAAYGLCDELDVRRNPIDDRSYESGGQREGA